MIINANSTVQHVIQIKNGIMINVNANAKSITHAKKDSWDPSTFICENSRCLKTIVDDSVIMGNEIINLKNIVSTKVTDAILTNVTNTVSITYADENVRYKMDCSILHKFLLVIILLFMFAIISFHATNYRAKQKTTDTNNVKMQNEELKKFVSKIMCCCSLFV